MLWRGIGKVYVLSEGDKDSMKGTLAWESQFVFWGSHFAMKYPGVELVKI